MFRVLDLFTIAGISIVQIVLFAYIFLFVTKSMMIRLKTFALKIRNQHKQITINIRRDAHTFFIRKKQQQQQPFEVLPFDFIRLICQMYYTVYSLVIHMYGVKYMTVMPIVMVIKYNFIVVVYIVSLSLSLRPIVSIVFATLSAN